MSACWALLCLGIGAPFPQQVARAHVPLSPLSPEQTQPPVCCCGSRPHGPVTPPTSLHSGPHPPCSHQLDSDLRTLSPWEGENFVWSPLWSLWWQE